MKELTPYQKSTLENTLLWVSGFPTHNKDTNECAPDFSCCHPDLFETDVEKRRACYVKLLQRYGVTQ